MQAIILPMDKGMTVQLIIIWGEDHLCVYCGKIKSIGTSLKYPHESLSALNIFACLNCRPLLKNFINPVELLENE